MIRILYSILIFLTIISTPYWFYLPIIVLGIIIFPLFVEAIVFGVLIDFAFGTPFSGNLWGFTYGILGAVLVYITLPLRSHLRFNV